MAPSKWDDEEEDSTPPSSPPTVPLARRGKFEDEEEDDSDVLESWDAAEDSEVEREKQKKVDEAKAKAEAEAKANHKSKSQRIEEKRQETMRRRQMEDDSSEEEEDEAEKRARLRKTEQDADLAHAQDLFGEIAISKNRAVKPVTIQDTADPTKALDLSSIALFNPNTKDQFLKLRETLVPLLTANSKKAHYTLFLQEFTKQIAKELPSDQIKKIASGLTTLSNEKMKEEKLAEKGGKKSKAAKTKTSLVASRDTSYRVDTNAYDDFGDSDDFM
ncbi:eukaryotic translation initiation factor-like protein 3 subunit EifCj [Mytilinidion resinicola]|uniref:Eukaryotic translation initiation factor 3 subunit J n=1 Tax=Mytilinidion resinicola TaxID=574789 RepID=A0A6A6YNW0_9PEZI|nr:eukaryotic translation initiation factor-like protein 3 subunit EifCj [Mytilinidion resinicola]KAF2810218.1 eukaryotic translation initiation factor-like protein 3 subunit EifCj [Mytilinidion resinicola]